MKPASTDTLRAAVEDVAWALSRKVGREPAEGVGLAVKGLMPHEALYVVAKAVMMAREDGEAKQ